MTDTSLQSNTAENETTHFGFTTVAKEEKVTKVAEVFHSVAAKYDIMNDLMSGGIHRLGSVLRSIAVALVLVSAFWI